MGKLLSYKEAEKNQELILDLIRSKGIEHEFSPLNSITVNLTVLAEVKGKVVANKVFPVLFSYRQNYSSNRSGSDYYDINIHWENEIVNYKSLGLFGYYSTDYNKIEYDKDYQQLYIFGDNNSKITIFLN